MLHFNQLAPTVTTETYADNDELVIEEIAGEGAYDAIAEMVSAKFLEDYLNGTVDYYKLIIHYKEASVLESLHWGLKRK